MKKTIIAFLTILWGISLAFSASSTVIGVRQTEGGEFEGVIADLEVNVLPGENRVYIDTTPLTEIDTQASARLASEVACETLSIDCDYKDFFYSISGEFPMIGGPSAGAAMTVLTMVELSEQSMNNNIAITGTINPDGSVGAIGGVLEKAIAADQAGIKTLIVPQGQGSEVANHTFSNGMSIIEVSTVREAYGYFTNTYFVEPSSEIDFQDFNEFMQPMSQDLINYSDDLFETLQTEHNISNLTVNDSVPVEIMLNSTKEQRSEMMELYDNGSYYSAASYAVGASINALYTTYMINHFQTNDSEYIDSLFNFAQAELISFENEINQTFSLDHINDLEALNIAIDRYFEAVQLYNEAIDFNNVNDTSMALYDISFVFVRLKTAEIWLGLLDVFEGDINIEFSQSLLRELALNRIDEATNMITYAESVDYSAYTLYANQHLVTSQNAYDNANYIYSLFESLKALSNANLAMQLRGVTEEQVDERIGLSKTQAAQNINLVQSNDLMPILALSYYEYSENFEQTNPAQSLLFLEYSKQFSLLSYQMVANIENEMVLDSFFTVAEPEEIGAQLSIVILGIIIGVGITLLLMYRLIQ